ncbi:acyl-homoserine-lactone acylase [Oxalobacteraceae bacterium GrIS 1.11]
MSYPSRYQPSSRLLALVGVVALATACSGGGGTGGAGDTSGTSGASGTGGTPSPVTGTKYVAEIRRTSFGVPHIKANDEGGLGYGVGYAYAQDNLCLLADEIVTVNGERSKYFGPDGSKPMSDVPNLQTDYFYRLLNDADAVNTAWQQQSAPIQALVSGYVAGYNRYLDQLGPANLPDECKNAAWVRKITTADMMKLVRRYAVESGSGQFIGAIVGAAPPGKVVARQSRVVAAQKTALNALDPQYWKRLHASMSSNAVAFGKDATENGQGMLLGNPHFPWQGALRFYQMHLTIPGKLDAMGASLAGLPLVNIGFNQNLAWSHTVNTSYHFTVHQLQLDPNDPSKYLVDGQSLSMGRKSVSVEVRNPKGGVTTQSRDFYSTRYGALMVVPGQLDWNGGVAYAMHDVNLDNHRMLEQWYAMNRAASLDEFKDAIERIVGLPWVNTLAADKDGKALYMDVTVVPNISIAKQNACVPAAFKSMAERGIVVLNGASAACDLDNDPTAPQPGIFAGAKLPSLMRDDYVQNSNDEAWLSNPAAPLTGFPAIVSLDGIEQGGRTRIGISQVQARLAGSDGLPGKRMTMAQLQSITLNNRVYRAGQILDDLLRVCAGDKQALAVDGAAVDLSVACGKLAAWDRTANLDANMGYVYFSSLWDRIAQAQNMWAVAFDAADPVNTPRGLNLADAAVVAQLRQALASTVQDVARQGFSPEAKWGDIQVALRGAKSIPIHGGTSEAGVYNAIGCTPTGKGLCTVTEGSSYIQTVMFDKNGPQAQAMLSYSQSSQAASPYFADQTERFSQKAWITQAYTEAQISADPAYKTMVISE